jgi:hypothetical protein
MMAAKSQKLSLSTASITTVKTYTLRVSLPGHGDCWRKIEIKSDQTLQTLHQAIQAAFDFDDDHLYSFFLSNKAWDKKTEYSLPEGVSPYGDMFDTFGEDQGGIEEIEETETNPFDLNVALDELSGKDPDKRKVYQEALDIFESLKPNKWKTFADEWSSKLAIESGEFIFQITRLKMLKELLQEIEHDMQSDVRTVTIEDLKLRVNKKFMYLFDYGDEWRFQVQVVSINKNVIDTSDFPRVIETFGEAPLQYPNEDDDWMFELEDGDEFEDGDESEDE